MSRLWAIIAAFLLLGCASDPQVAPPPKSRVPAGEPLAVLFSEIDRSLSEPESQIDLAYLSLLMSRVLDSSVDADATLRKLDQMAAEARRYYRELDDLRTKLEGIGRYLFLTLKLTPVNEESYRWIPQVLQSRKGSCAGLTQVYLALSHRLGLGLRTAQAPNHIFVRAADEGGEFNVETTTGGTVVASEWYEQNLGPIRPGFYMQTLTTSQFVGVLLSHHLGHELKKLGRFPEALSCLERASRLFASSPDIGINLASALRSLGRLQEAIALLDRVVNADPGNSTAWHNRANALGDIGRLAEALESIEKALEASPRKATYHARKALFLSQAGRSEEAISAVNLALEINPVDGEALGVKATILGNLDRHEEALAVYDRAIKVMPGEAIWWFNRGNSLSKLQRHQDSLESYQKALELMPRYAAAMAGKATALCPLRRLDEAQAAASSAIELDPKDARSWIAKANVHAARKEKKEARASVEKAQALGATFPPDFLQSIQE